MKASTTAKTRMPRPVARVSQTKSRAHSGFDRITIDVGVLVVTEMMNVELEAALCGAPADSAVGMAEN